MERYESGRQLMIVGRGAFTARSLAGLIRSRDLRRYTQMYLESEMQRAGPAGAVCTWDQELHPMASMGRVRACVQAMAGRGHELLPETDTASSKELDPPRPRTEPTAAGDATAKAASPGALG
ncbi:hypothetical protein GCM10011415_04400 [Salipiger pallidus]|uniref:Uncharacterized protein n=1 Tax=Salipiger pallidus TaxID=1775170 RepID=A0A8J2ZGT3_9RHOB|nr:hypothetical protein GCM10011415_04400 [Salipiger pallidus]